MCKKQELITLELAIIALAKNDKNIRTYYENLGKTKNTYKNAIISTGAIIATSRVMGNIKAIVPFCLVFLIMLF